MTREKSWRTFFIWKIGILHLRNQMNYSLFNRWSSLWDLTKIFAFMEWVTKINRFIIKFQNEMCTILAEDWHVQSIMICMRQNPSMKHKLHEQMIFFSHYDANWVTLKKRNMQNSDDWLLNWFFSLAIQASMICLFNKNHFIQSVK